MQYDCIKMQLQVWLKHFKGIGGHNVCKLSSGPMAKFRTNQIHYWKDLKKLLNIGDFDLISRSTRSYNSMK